MSASARLDFSRFSIAPRVSTLAALAFVGVAIAAIYVVVDEHRQASRAETLLRYAALTPQISAVVDNLQRERGISAGLIGAKGEGAFIQRLRRQRRESDAAMAAEFSPPPATACS